MSGFGWVWFGLAVVQLAVAGYALAAAATWRGERLWPAPGRPLGAVPAATAGAALLAAVASLVWVGDVEFTRFFGTGAVMVAALVLVALLLRRGGAER